MSYFAVDYAASGAIDNQGNLKVYTDLDAIHNSMKLWLASFRGEKMRMPGKGGPILRALFKPMSDEAALEIRRGVQEGLRNDFSPPITTTSIEVTPDYEHDTYIISVRGYCPSYRAQIAFDEKVRKL